MVREIHLYGSVDRGRSWEIYNRQLAGAKEFPFQANEDGEFWFAIKTVDMNGRTMPAGRPVAEMIVFVDTHNPELSFNVHTDASGRVDCWWRATDQTLNAESLEVYYRRTLLFRPTSLVGKSES